MCSFFRKNCHHSTEKKEKKIEKSIVIEKFLHYFCLTETYIFVIKIYIGEQRILYLCTQQDSICTHQRAHIVIYTLYIQLKMQHFYIIIERERSTPPTTI